MLWTVIGCLAAYIVIKEGVDLYQSKKAAKVDPTVDPKAPVVMGSAADPIGIADLTAKLQAWAKSIGMNIEQINAEIDQIKAFAIIVLIQPHILKVVSADKQAEITAAFTSIRTAIGIDPPK